MRVAVVGGGIVGLCCARELAARGADTVVIDGGDRRGVAGPASAGWITPLLSAPLSGPGVVTQSAWQLLRGRAPFSVRPTPSPHLLGWLWRFVRSGTAQRQRDGLRAMLDLGAASVRLFAEMRAGGVDFEMHETGLLLAARTQRGLDGARTLTEQARAAGYGGTCDELDERGLRRVEPALATGLAGGVHARAEAHVRPEALLDALADAVRDVVDLRTGTVAYGVEPDTKGTGRPPTHAVKLVEPSIATAPFADGLRIAGRFDLGRKGHPYGRTSVSRLLAATRQYLADWTPDDARLEYTGMRPATPDSLPLIGAVPGRDGVFAATGHGMLGLTLAPATAAALIPQVLGDAPSPVLAPFALERFAGS